MTCKSTARAISASELKKNINSIAYSLLLGAVCLIWVLKV